MKVIVLYGKHNSGKTLTLKDVFTSLQNKTNVKSHRSKYLPKNDIEYTFDYNGKHIALESAGDCRDFIRNIIDKYHNTIPVDVLIIAYNQQIKTIYSNILEADEIHIVHKSNNHKNDCSDIINLI